MLVTDAENEVDVGLTTVATTVDATDDPCSEGVAQCRAIKCPYGVERFMGGGGCDECRCHDPCKGFDCPDGTHCKVDFVRETIEHDQRVHTTVQPICRKSNCTGFP